MIYKFILFLLIISFQGFGQEENESLMLGKLDGEWGMINYFDSTLIDKSVFKHLNNPSSYAAILHFDKLKVSECIFKGYHEGGPIPILEIEDRFVKVGYDWNQYAKIVLVNDSTLAFNEHVSDEENDLRSDDETYYYRKLTEGIVNCQQYFSQIINGNYKDSNNKSISFKEGFKVTGVGNFTSYKLLIDLWEESVGNFDAIQLIDDVSNGSVWEFDGQKLILTHLNRYIDKESGMYKYIPSKRTIILTRI